MATKTLKAQTAQAADMLRKDHKKSHRAFFRKFEKMDNAQEKQEVVDTVLTELEIHAEVGEITHLSGRPPENER